MAVPMATPQTTIDQAKQESHRGDLQSTSDPPLVRERNPSQWLMDDEEPSCEEGAGVPARATGALLSSTVNEDLRLGEEIGSDTELEGIIGRSLALSQVLELVKMVASSDSTVLLLGETGTGKELIARAIHKS